MELRTYQTECIDTIEAQPPGAYLAQMATRSQERPLPLQIFPGMEAEC